MAVERMRGSDNIGELAKELGVTRRCLYKWRTKLDYLEPGQGRKDRDRILMRRLFESRSTS
jgi:transposase-like protein